MSEVFLSVNNVFKSFAGVQALKGVSISIGKGEIRCLAGENGSGKSTLIKVISGFYTPDSGEIIIEGNKHTALSPIESIRNGIQVIYQDFSIFPNLTVAENISLNSQLADNKRLMNWAQIRANAQAALNRIGVKMDLDIKVEMLSVADKQLVAISRALLQNAKLIIMDEPTTALTQKEVSSLFKIIKQVQKEGIATLFVSHKLDEVLEISEKVTILRNGENVVDGDVKDFDMSKFVYYMTGREIVSTTFAPKTGDKEPLLKVENLSLKGGFKDISFELFKGEILGITGLLGSGRTELALSIFGAHPANKGNIYVKGKKVKIHSILDAIRNKIAYVPEDRLTEGLFLPQSINRNIQVSVLKRYRKKLGIYDKKSAKENVQKWVKELSIKTADPELPVVTLSGGNQQRVVLAKWLASDPEILILNGPTVGVDIGSKTDIHQIIRNLAEKGFGIIVISDDIPEVLHNCNRILIMKKGRIVGETDNRSITEKELSMNLSQA